MFLLGRLWLISGCLLLGCSLCWLLLLGKIRCLERLRADLDKAESLNEGWKTAHSLEPSSDCRHTLLETNIEANLEGNSENTGEVDISDSALISKKPSLASCEALVQSTEQSLERLDGIHILVVEGLHEAESCLSDHRCDRSDLRVGKGEVLLDLDLFIG